MALSHVKKGKEWGRGLNSVKKVRESSDWMDDHRIPYFNTMVLLVAGKKMFTITELVNLKSNKSFY